MLQLLVLGETVVGGHLVFGFGVFLLKLTGFGTVDEGLGLFIEPTLVVVEFISDPLLTDSVKVHPHRRALLIHKLLLLENPVNGKLPVCVVGPLVLRKLVVVYLLVKNVGDQVVGGVTVYQDILVLDGFGSLDPQLDELFLVHVGEELFVFLVHEGVVGAADHIAAEKAGAFAFGFTHHLTTVSAVVDEAVLLGHTVAQESLGVDGLGLQARELGGGVLDEGWVFVPHLIFDYRLDRMEDEGGLGLGFALGFIRGTLNMGKLEKVIYMKQKVTVPKSFGGAMFSLAGLCQDYDQLGVKEESTQLNPPLNAEKRYHPGTLRGTEQLLKTHP